MVAERWSMMTISAVMTMTTTMMMAMTMDTTTADDDGDDDGNGDDDDDEDDDDDDEDTCLHEGSSTHPACTHTWITDSPRRWAGSADARHR